VIEYKNCHSCNNVGWYAVHGPGGEPEQEQCEFCYTVENSIFNVISHLEQQLATAKQEATAYRISLENLEASLPKVRADAVNDFSNNMQELVAGAHAEGDVALRMMLEFSIRMANAYTTTLEQGAD